MAAGFMILTMALAAGNTGSPFGKTATGEQVELYTLRNNKHAEASITTYGATLVSLKVPDRVGAVADVVLGFDTLDDYVKRSPFFGATVGRYANRIAHGKFSLDGVEYSLPKNNGENTLHGGSRGFDKRVWQVKRATPQLLELSYLSRDGEEGFPGNLQTTVTYTLDDKNELRIDYAATTDKPTVLNLTNHSYFNLAGQGEGDVLKHEITIPADRITPIDRTLIPTGELQRVDGTPFDFRQPHAIGERIDASNEQLQYGRGYDHNFVLNRSGAGLHLAATVVEPDHGRKLEVLTTEPGVQFYTANTLNIANAKAGKSYGKHAAFCLETQHFPDSPNQPSFPSVVLKPGEHFRSTTVYHFSVQRPL
jgi:aldose 1-epimerase